MERRKLSEQIGICGDVLMTIRKINLLDDDELRNRIDALYEIQPQITIAKWSLEIAKRSICICNICENSFPEVAEGFRINEMWQAGKARMHEVRQAGFAIHKVARAQTDELLTVTFRVIGQAVASGHMKEHGMVASYYAIKLINLIYPCDMSKVIEERQWQLSKLDELSQ